jgi:hypothetical protein
VPQAGAARLPELQLEDEARAMRSLKMQEALPPPKQKEGKEEAQPRVVVLQSPEYFALRWEPRAERSSPPPEQLLGAARRAGARRPSMPKSQARTEAASVGPPEAQPRVWRPRQARPAAPESPALLSFA